MTQGRQVRVIAHVARLAWCSLRVICCLSWWSSTATVAVCSQAELESSHVACGQWRGPFSIDACR
jgi:hypothetical protein